MTVIILVVIVAAMIGLFFMATRLGRFLHDNEVRGDRAVEKFLRESKGKKNARKN